MFNTEFNSLIELMDAFRTQEICIRYLEKIRWEGKVVSPFDPASRVYNCKGHRYKCKNTGKYFNVMKDTMFENTKIPLRLWFAAIWLITCEKKGITSVQLSRHLNVTQSTAWFLAHRIRNCFGIENYNELSGTVEVDETYIGGKNKNRHYRKKTRNAQGRRVDDKTPVFGMVQRGGRVTAIQVKNVRSSTVLPIINDSVIDGSQVFTDEFVAYRKMQSHFNWQMINHSKGRYVSDGVHTNTIEGFWSILKRGITGLYHFTSKKHLQKYIDEFVFRYNTRHLSDQVRFEFLLSNFNHRLTYKTLIDE